MADYDLAIIGGGLTGAGIARDAAGRGLSVVLIEQGDLASGASQASSGLIAGDLEHFERRALLRVRSALAERNLLARLAPHLVRPVMLVLPVHPEDRSPWRLRSELFLYDRLAPACEFPYTAALDLTHHEAGYSLKRSFRRAFAYTGAVVDEARLVVLNAVDAAERGAKVHTGARCVRADREEEWRLGVIDRGHRRTITARALVNATGAWLNRTAETVLRRPAPRARLMRESRIVLRCPFDHHGIYVFRHTDDRLIFVRPQTDGFAVIGMIDHEFTADPAVASPTAGEIAYLCDAANRYFREQFAPTDVVRAVCAVRAHSPRSNWRRDAPAGTLALDRPFHEAPLVTVFGGDAAMYRQQAEDVMAVLAPYFAMRSPWTGTTPLAGGDFSADLDEEVDRARMRWRFLTDAHARRLICAYGTRIARILGDAQSMTDLGPLFGQDLTGAEVRYLTSCEWARTEDDVLTRRSKLGLAISPQARSALIDFIKASVPNPKFAPPIG
jgi:glycerol-3-phosphate dehydrogenase